MHICEKCKRRNAPRILSTDTHTTSIIRLSTSLPQPPPESQRHPQINSCTETSAEQTIWSQCSPGPAVFWAELLLLLPATTALALLGAGTQGAAPRQHHCFLAGEHHASPNLIQLPSTCTTCFPELLAQKLLAQQQTIPKPPRLFPRRSGEVASCLCFSFGCYPAFPALMVSHRESQILLLPRILLFSIYFYSSQSQTFCKCGV